MASEKTEKKFKVRLTAPHSHVENGERVEKKEGDVIIVNENQLAAFGDRMILVDGKTAQDSIAEAAAKAEADAKEAEARAKAEADAKAAK